MIKFTSNNDFDFHCDSSVLLRDVSSDLVKRASCESLFKGIKKDPKQENLHIIALGAYESTGKNRNSDAFLEKDCRTSHKQFVNANRAVHRHHKNKPTDPKFGNIKASAYNEKMGRVELVVGLDKDKCADILHEQDTTGNTNWSMACFPAGSLVRMSDGSEKAIDNIQIGDSVITHTGGIGKVTDTFNKPYTDTAIRFRANGAIEPIFCTKNHPIWVRGLPVPSSPCPVCGKSFKSLKAHLWQTKDTQHQHALKNLDRMYEGWVAAENLKVGDYATTPFNTAIDNTGANSDYAKLLGWYLAEGHYYRSTNVRTSSHSLDFTLNIAETAYVAEIVSLLGKLGVEDKDIRIYNYPKSHKQVVRCRNLEIAQQLVDDGGSYSYGKVISRRVMLWEPSIQLHILERWLEGDGTVGKLKGNVSGITVSRMLALNLAEIAYRNGLVPALSSHKPGVYRPQYTLTFTNEQSQKLDIVKKTEFIRSARTMDMGKLKPWQAGTTAVLVYRDATQAYIEGNRVYRRINRISREFLDATVYDITVPGDDSFTVNGIGVHNSKQAYDRCSICDHKAKSDKDRCEHIPSQLGEIKPDGRSVHMINDNPNWFEISYVRRPADRIGMSLGKVASSGGLKPLSSSDYLNLYPDIYVPDDLIISKKASDKRAILHKLAAIEKHIDAVAHSKPQNSKDSYIKEHAHKISKTPPIDNLSMETLRKMDPSMVLKTLADKGILFSPEDFSKYLFDNRLDKKHVEGMKTHLPSAFQDHEDDGEVCNNERFDPNYIGKVKPELKDLAGKLHEGHSLEGEPSVRRIMIISISGGLKPSRPDSKTKEAADKELAKQYISYKTAALNYMDEQGKLTDEILLNAVLQNR